MLFDMIMMQCLCCWILSNVLRYFLHEFLCVSRLSGNGMQFMHSKCTTQNCWNVRICKINVRVRSAFMCVVDKYRDNVCIDQFAYWRIYFSRKFSFFIIKLSRIHISLNSEWYVLVHICKTGEILQISLFDAPDCLRIQCTLHSFLLCIRCRQYCSVGIRN